MAIGRPDAAIEDANDGLTRDGDDGDDLEEAEGGEEEATNLERGRWRRTSCVEAREGEDAGGARARARRRRGGGRDGVSVTGTSGS